jgi:hypothetical protein
MAVEAKKGVTSFVNLAANLIENQPKARQR